MIHPHDLIGLQYRLGSNPEKHGTADCLSLAKAVLAYQGIETPEPERSWYRRLRRGDTDVFRDELQRWGELIPVPKIGTVGLCQADNGYGMASYWEDGWICFISKQVVWAPINGLEIVGCYSQKLPHQGCMPQGMPVEPVLLS